MTDVSAVVGLSTLQNTTAAVSDVTLVQLIASRYARLPLAVEDVRDVRVAALLLDINARGTASQPWLGLREVAYSEEFIARVAVAAGISRARMASAVTRLLETGALSIRDDGNAQHLGFSDRVLRSAGAEEHLDWPSIAARVSGSSAAFLIFRGVLDEMRIPWEWTPITYESLAQRSSYSLGMVRHGISHLLQADVLERTVHAGRGHEYRCSAWALGRRNRTVTEMLSSRTGASVSSSASASPVSWPPSVNATEIAPADNRGDVAVELGGLVLRVPVGTEIRVRLDETGHPCYEVGPYLRFKSP